jgi:hypothetical protein
MKKALPAAIALASGMGLAASAVAQLHVNHEGHGQVLLYPYYTVNSGNDTYVSITNTTDETKAVKVRFVDALNSNEVLDFNLYMSPQDVWVGALSQNADGGASLTTVDETCSVPSVKYSDKDYSVLREGGVKFKTAKFAETDTITTADRTATGHIEVIEMGVVMDEYYEDAALHGADGKPDDCPAFYDAWVEGETPAGDGEWIAGDNNLDVGLPTGGLYGSQWTVNSAGGHATVVDAVALDGWADPDQVVSPDEGYLHYKPGDTSPALENGTSLFMLPETGGLVHDAGNGLDAVSAVLLASNVMADYATDASIMAATDIVVTFPTKNGYVNLSPDSQDDALFVSEWDGDDACESFTVTYYDREEATQVPPAGVTPGSNPPDFSPAPPPPPPGTTTTAPVQFCYEANVVGVNAVDGGAAVLGDSLSRIALDMDADANDGGAGDNFMNGWVNMDLTGASWLVESVATSESHTLIVDADINGEAFGPAPVEFSGLPVIGFTTTALVNNGVKEGVLANYQVSSGLKKKLNDPVALSVN